MEPRTSRKRKRDGSDEELLNDELLGTVGEGWAGVLRGERKKSYYGQMLRAVEKAKIDGILPDAGEIMAAFKKTHWKDVRVVMIGQFPGRNGLAWCRDGPVMDRICSEITGENLQNLKNIDLGSWAADGVLLLSSTLTAPSSSLTAHEKIGWHTFTDTALESLNSHHPIVFLLLGGFAERKADLITNSRHVKLTYPHPMTGSWEGCRAFKKCNEALAKLGEPGVRWNAVLKKDEGEKKGGESE